MECHNIINYGVPNGIRTRVPALKGRRPRPLDDGDIEKTINLNLFLVKKNAINFLLIFVML